jgi:Family of unknown function (DUF5686)/CarboxypepD_reg-like domain
MKNRHTLFSLLFFLTLTFAGFSIRASTIHGRITDPNGTPLPYATIFVDGTTIGTTANGLGVYELSLQPGLYKIVCQMIGFRQNAFNCSLEPDQNVNHDFKLTAQSLDLKEFDVHANAEDPAYGIIRKAIARRTYHLEQIHSFQSSIYLKTVGRSRSLPDKFMGSKIKTPDLDVDSAGKGVLYLSEEYADYYNRNGKEQTVIHSVHESGDPNGLGMAKLPPVLTFYDNNLKIFSTRGSISPISENALFYYKYKYLGDFTENGHTVNKIQVTQKRAYEPCFNGYIYITDDDWAIHSTDLTLVKESGIALFDTVHIRQQYLPLGADQWVIKNQWIYITAKIFAFDITGTLTALYDNQKINQPLPDSLFHDKIVSIYDKTANKKDTGYWNSMHLMPLERDEIKNFHVQDSLNHRVATPQYLDSVRRAQNKLKIADFLFSGKTFYGKEKRNSFSINSLLFMSNYNIVDGANVAPSLSWRHMCDTGKYLNIQSTARYGFSNTRYGQMGRIYYTTEDRHWKGRRWIVGAEGGKSEFQYNPANPVFPFLNSLDALLFHQNELKLYQRSELAAFVERKYGNGISWNARISWQDRSLLSVTNRYSLFGGEDASYNSNTPGNLLSIDPYGNNIAALARLEISWKPGITFVQYPDYKQPESSKLPTFRVSVTKGTPGIGNSVSDFLKYRFSVADDMNLKLLGSLSYNLSVGGFAYSNYVAAPDLEIPYGNRSFGLATPYLTSFQFMPVYGYGNKADVFGEGHVEYRMKGFLSNKLPLFRQSQLYLCLGGSAFYVSNSNYYTEAHFGVDNIGWKAVRIFRLDFVQSWDSNMGRNSGLRLGISTSGVSVSINGSGADTHSEW